MLDIHVFELILPVFVPREVRMNEVWRSVRAALALQLERKTSHKHSCYYVFYIYWCSMLNVLIYKAVNTWKMM